MSRYKKDHTMAGAIYVLGLLCMFAFTALIVVGIGAKVYRHTLNSTQENFELRTSLSYVTTKVRQSDSAGMIRVEDIDNQKALVLSEEIDGDRYETWIYHYKGQLYEQFMDLSAEFLLEDGMPIIKIAEFKAEITPKNLLLLSVKNKQGKSQEVLLSLRSSSSDLEQDVGLKE